MRDREQGQDSDQTERSQWVLSPPNPPPLWKKLITPLKNKLFFVSSNKKKTCHGHAVSFLQSLFPILSWFRNYDTFKFKDDLLAGLTLASLSIPQVYNYIYHSQTLLLSSEQMFHICGTLLTYLYSSNLLYDVTEYRIC